MADGGGPGRVEGGVAHGLAKLQQDGEGEAHGEGRGGLVGVARGGGAQEDGYQQGRAQDLDEQDAGHRRLDDGVLAEAGGHGVESGPGVLDLGDGPQDAEQCQGSGKRADELRAEVGRGFRQADAAGDGVAQRDCRVEVAAGNVAERQHGGGDGQAGGEGGGQRVGLGNREQRDAQARHHQEQGAEGLGGQPGHTAPVERLRSGVQIGP